MSESYSGWLLDLYAGKNGIILWLLGDDGQRRRFHARIPGHLLRCRASSAPARAMENDSANGQQRGSRPE